MRKCLRTFIIIVFAVLPVSVFGTAGAAYAKEQTVYHVPPKSIAAYIAKQKGRKIAVLVWASWCPACRNNMDKYISYEKKFPGSMIMISVDSDLEQLKNYLNRKNLEPLKVIVVKKTAGQDLNSALKKLGISPVRSYPTAILLNENSVVVRQGSGSSMDIGFFLRQQARFRPPPPPEPTQEEKEAALKKYGSFTKPLYILAPNTDNGLHDFLDQHTGETVFFNSLLWRYHPTPKGASIANRDQMPPTDRFENPVFQRCWGKEYPEDGYLEKGYLGFPLPRDEKDIENGCSARIKFEFIYGEGHANTTRYSGMDKLEVSFGIFFKIQKEILPDQKTLYTLKEMPVSPKEAEIYLKHGPKVDLSTYHSVLE
ncbi:MAG: thioredoxin family protein [Alphaproteobacteria bacterium]|nr:thioredoxin family protein [Alphaproteobacteria bacterium]MCB9974544.1 redoxin family protein [Rhodospirillales bacterium]